MKQRIFCSKMKWPGNSMVKTDDVSKILIQSTLHFSQNSGKERWWQESFLNSYCVNLLLWSFWLRLNSMLDCVHYLIQLGFVFPMAKKFHSPIFQENEICFVSCETGHSNLDTWTHLVHSPCILSLLFVGHFHMKVFHGKDSKSCPGACKSFQCMLPQSPSSTSSKYLHVSSFPQNICFFCNVVEIWEYQWDWYYEIW